MLSHLGKLSGVDGPMRVTNPLLDVLLDAFDTGGQELHGWAIMKAVQRSGPTVYGVLDRLEDCGWVTARWEQQHPEGNKPRRRFYVLTAQGGIQARSLVVRRRPRPDRIGRGLPRPGLAFRAWWRGLAAAGAR